AAEAGEKLAEAETLARRVVEAGRKVLGEEHPYTWKTVGQLARGLKARERYAEAEEMRRVALGGLLRARGSEHADVARCDAEHTRILELLGKGAVEAGVADSGREVVDEAVIIQLEA